MTRRGLLAVAGWAGAAVAATSAGFAAVHALGAGITGHETRPLTPGQVGRALTAPASDGPGTPTDGPARAAPSPSAGGTTRGFSTAGGVLLARCGGGSAFLLSWSPAQGYSTDEVVRGPARVVSIEFASARRRVESVVTCRNGVPVQSTDDHGGGHGRGRGHG